MPPSGWTVRLAGRAALVWLGAPEEAARYPEFRARYMGVAADGS